MTGYNQYVGTKLSSFESAKLVTDLANGLSKRQAAAKYGVSLTTVYRILAREEKPAPLLAKCGTNSGYMRHKKKKEPVCLPCRVAHSKVNTKYDKANRKDRNRVEYCLSCGNPIKIAIRKGSGSCSNRCDKNLGRNSGVKYEPKDASRISIDEERVSVG